MGSQAGGCVNWAALGRYEQSNARDKVFGYMVSRKPMETAEQEFERAKAECLKHLRIQMEQIECMSFADFPAKPRHQAPAQSADDQTHE